MAKKRLTPGQAALQNLFRSVGEMSKNWKAIHSGLRGFERQASDRDAKQLTAIGEFLSDLGHNVWLSGFNSPSRVRRQKRMAAAAKAVA